MNHFEFRIQESGFRIQNISFGPLATGFLLLIFFLLSACESEIIRKQAEELRLQQEELMRQRQEVAELTKEEKKRQDCNLAFRDFEEAQATREASEAVALYRQGLKLCPDDDVAHYELGKILLGLGQSQEAQQEFEAALRINPNFFEAKRQLEKLKIR